MFDEIPTHIIDAARECHKRIMAQSEGVGLTEARAVYNIAQAIMDAQNSSSDFVKQAPEIEIRDLREMDSEGLMGFYARGHFDRWKFARACNVYTGADYFHDERHVPEGLPDYVRHEWWRCVPVSGEPGMSQYVSAEPKSRGAFPVTVTTVLEDRQRKRVQREINEHQKGERTGFANGLNWALRQLDNINPDAGEKLLAYYRAQDKK